MSKERTLDEAYTADIEKKELKQEEDTSVEEVHLQENEEEDDSFEDDQDSQIDDEEDDQDEDESEEETVTLTKAEHAKLLQERDNYKKGLLSKKAKDRSLDEKGQTPKVSVSEKAVLQVLEKQNEQKALKSVVDKESKNYIPELVDDGQYSQIVGYLPRNIDRSSTKSIVKALRIATKLWKEDMGIVDTKPKSKNAGSELGDSVSKTSSGASTKKAKTGRKILTETKSMSSWY